MGIIADSMRETLQLLKQLDEQQADRTDALVRSTEEYIRSVDTLLENLSDIGED